jgi:protein-S-isoprenylcysteine O-methyltransferase Ste14
MALVNRTIAVCWISFVAYWLVSARYTKRTAKATPWWGGTLGRTAIILLVFLVLRSPFFWHPFTRIVGRYAAIVSTPVTRCVGAGICVLGLAFAVWARVHLGRNWGQPMTLREGHELVTTGPYAYVRHPIYTGIIFALVGTALAENIMLLAPFAALCAFFVLSAATEEKHMLREFPHEYPEYKGRTKMLIPFVL